MLMKLYTFYAYSLCLLLVNPTTSFIISPEEGGCWASTFAIISAEILAVFDVALYNTQRTYILCEGIITVGDVPAGASGPVGGDYPLVVFNPNLHLLCEIPGTCILDGGTHGEELLTNEGDSLLVRSFLSFNGLPPPPADYVVDSSNLLVEGIVFSGASAARADAPIELPGPGLNMVFQNCIWTANDLLNPPQSVIYLQYAGHRGLAPGELYQSLTIKDSVIEDNTFSYSFVRTSWNGVQPPAGSIVNQVTLDGTVFQHNVIEGDIRGDIIFSQRPAFFTLFSTRLLIKDTSIISNAIGRFNGLFSLENGAEIIVMGDSKFLHITASEPLNLSGCGGAVLWDVSSDTNITCNCSENVTFTEVGCLAVEDIFPTPTPPPTPPRYSSTLTPTVRMLGGAGGEVMGNMEHKGGMNNRDMMDTGKMMGMAHSRALTSAVNSSNKRATRIRGSVAS